MLRRLESLFGSPVMALDGKAGNVTDFLLDDQTWSIRYLIAETGSWLRPREVVVPVAYLGAIDHDRWSIPVDLTVEQFGNWPERRTMQYVAGRYQVATSHCKLPPQLWTGVIAADSVWPDGSPSLRHPGGDESEDANLRSVREVITYRAEGIDGEIGLVDGLVVDASTWAVHRILVRTGFWPLSKLAEFAPRCVEGVSWEHQNLRAAVTRGSLKYRRDGLLRSTYRAKDNEIVSLRDGSHKPGA